MHYHIQSWLRPTEAMLPEEEQVQAALREYCFDIEKTTREDYTQTSTLYAAYLKYVGQFKQSPDSPDVLSAVQFGIALRKVFQLDPARKSKRRCRGKLVWGYMGVAGPGSVKVHPTSGNPNFIRNRKLTTEIQHATAPVCDSLPANIGGPDGDSLAHARLGTGEAIGAVCC